jgi:hypothetical protein
MRSLPDLDLSLRDASDFIFDSALGRRALDDPTPRPLANFMREIIHTIYRLTLSCHLSEFTDHGLGHLCSLIDRLSKWSRIGAENSSHYVVRDLTPTEAGTLLMATLLHDIGMLSQRPEDLPPEHAGTRSLEDVPAWVRNTHVIRMERLTRRLFRATRFESLLDEPLLLRAFAIARAHCEWPKDWAPFSFPENDAGLAAMLAVADLLDENATRCDSQTLLRHRFGSALNCAHWIHHSLTTNRVLVIGGRVNVKLARPPQTDARIEPVMTALRNHYRLALLYVSELSQVGAALLSVDFDPSTGLPTDEANEIRDWNQMPEFRFQSALVYQLLESFMPQALLDPRRVPPADIQRLMTFGLQPVDLTDFYRIRGALAPRTAIERSFHALLGT